jgi:hypothetical protein
MKVRRKQEPRSWSTPLNADATPWTTVALLAEI